MEQRTVTALGPTDPALGLDLTDAKEPQGPATPNATVHQASDTPEMNPLSEGSAAKASVITLR